MKKEKTYTKKEILKWLEKKVLGFPRPDAEMLKEQSQMVGRIEKGYEIYDAVKRDFK